MDQEDNLNPNLLYRREEETRSTVAAAEGDNRPAPGQLSGSFFKKDRLAGIILWKRVEKEIRRERTSPSRSRSAVTPPLWSKDSHWPMVAKRSFLGARRNPGQPNRLGGNGTPAKQTPAIGRGGDGQPGGPVPREG